MDAKFCVILVRRDIDRFSHNDLFAKEIVGALQRKGWVAKILDYIAQSRETFDALRDKNCRFFITFNGFGTELLMPTGTPGRLESAFQVFNRPVFDLMHDCPLHETMAHQMRTIAPFRRLLSTDGDYAWFAKLLGIRTVVPAATICFPHSVEPQIERDIEILFAVGLSSPDLSKERLSGLASKSRVFRLVFDEVTAACKSNWSANPITELLQLLQTVGLEWSVQDEDFRFLLTIILDHVKFSRRHMMLDALRDLPVTLVTDRQVPGLHQSVKIAPARSASELLAMMARSKVVVCPNTHAVGFHERPFMAFSAGAVVVSAPNGQLEASFSHGQDILFFHDAKSLASSVERAVVSPLIGDRGREKAGACFSPDRLVETILNDRDLLD
jgi:hypothetical protein